MRIMERMEFVMSLQSRTAVEKLLMAFFVALPEIIEILFQLLSLHQTQTIPFRIQYTFIRHFNLLSIPNCNIPVSLQGVIWT